MIEPRQLALQAEEYAHPPEGTEERFSGYGVMGLTFRSGHVLGMRRFPGSSIGSGYTSVWHRAPSGEWTFYQDVPPDQACPRYFGPSLRRALVRPVHVYWTTEDALLVEVDHGFTVRWEVQLAAPLVIRALNLLAGAMPETVWHSERALHAIGAMAGRVLHTGRMALSGEAPSRQHFVANPHAAWTIPVSHARIDGVDVGEVGPLPVQEHLGDFWMPQRGLFVVGDAFFEPLDPGRHRIQTHAEARSSHGGPC